jgi:PAS domain S-box-containing protein
MAKGLIVAGRHGVVLRHNPRAAEVLGRQGESLHGMHVRDLFAISPGTLEILGRAMAASGDADRTRTLPIGSRVSVPGSAGEERVLELGVSLIDPRLLESEEDQNQPCFVFTFDDVTEQVHSAQRDARRARLAAMGEIAAKLGHEIRNSLGGLRLYVENIRDVVSPDPGAKRAADGMIREIESLYRKIDELRQYGVDPKLDLAACDLKELLNEALQYSSHKLGTRNVRAVLDCDSRLPPVRVDRRQMREAFQNLINNAIEAAPRGGWIAIHAEHTSRDNGTPPAHRVHVDDNGPGIAPEIADQVFSLFFTTKPDIGTGLGLPMVKKIVESHGGTVSFAAHDEGGTRFTVTLPNRGEERST